MCAKCHANYDPGASFATDIKFSHGYHVKMQCSDCHTKFPHQKSGHAAPDDEDVHELPWPAPRTAGHHRKVGTAARVTTRRSGSWRARTTRLADWAGKGTSSRATSDATNDCMMCHQQSDCTTATTQQRRFVGAQTGWAYDPGEPDAKTGCYACHGDSTLLAPVGVARTSRFRSPGSTIRSTTRSRVSSAIPTSATTIPAATKLWNVNAGLQCAACHQNLKDKKLSQPVAEYEKSTHAQKIREAATTTLRRALVSRWALHLLARHRRREGARCMPTRIASARVATTTSTTLSTTTITASRTRMARQMLLLAGSATVRTCPWRTRMPRLDREHQPISVRTCGQPGCHKGSTEQFA